MKTAILKIVCLLTLTLSVFSCATDEGISPVINTPSVQGYANDDESESEIASHTFNTLVISVDPLSDVCNENSLITLHITSSYGLSHTVIQKLSEGKTVFELKKEFKSGSHSLKLENTEGILLNSYSFYLDEEDATKSLHKVIKYNNCEM
ncbi:hypothetical protein [Flammeovirga kamogawensis]|uniref:Lipoprotein n=1 Tax=Flammeovirga kamogawensis TaxID=373891 RepID=A0ABX8GVY3_9BACT|nr:hypothetical protein [Flammeovirga kamogawensis]MBB6461193.1 hypothetical protein [Flammeovirga kamogawensis]QWG07756.1 hypothetical protein KM029_02110 [Flammeovirga kamogawensis]TRX69562.1 hypothetical protein EO216_16045 [Flammeovirga kamogawensis]